VIEEDFKMIEICAVNGELKYPTRIFLNANN
jgi:hypothetical protein